MWSPQNLWELACQGWGPDRLIVPTLCVGTIILSNKKPAEITFSGFFI
jgi:hypothetical protein